MNLIFKLELDIVLEKREKKKIMRCVGCGGYIILLRIWFDLIMIIILFKNLILCDNKFVLSLIICFICNKIWWCIFFKKEKWKFLNKLYVIEWSLCY